MAVCDFSEIYSVLGFLGWEISLENLTGDKLVELEKLHHDVMFNDPDDVLLRQLMKGKVNYSQAMSQDKIDKLETIRLAWWKCRRDIHRLSSDAFKQAIKDETFAQNIIAHENFLNEQMRKALEMSRGNID